MDSISPIAIDKSALAALKEEITDIVMADVVDLLPTTAAIVSSSDVVLAAPMAGSRWTVVDGVWGKEQRAKEEEHPIVQNPTVDLDIDTIGNILQCIHSLRIYCFPKPTPFVWNTGASRFLFHYRRLRSITRLARCNSIPIYWSIRRQTRMLINERPSKNLERTAWRS